MCHELPGMQRCTHGKTRAKTLRDRHFPAHIPHVSGSCEHVVGDGVRCHFIYQKRFLMVTGKGFSFFRARCGDVFQAILQVVGSERGADFPGEIVLVFRLGRYPEMLQRAVHRRFKRAVRQVA